MCLWPHYFLFIARGEGWNPVRDILKVICTISWFSSRPLIFHSISQNKPQYISWSTGAPLSPSRTHSAADKMMLGESWSCLIGISGSLTCLGCWGRVINDRCVNFCVERCQYFAYLHSAAININAVLIWEVPPAVSILEGYFNYLYSG